MKIDKPRSSIKSQSQTSLPTNSDATIMDDTVVTMDSATALMGGPTVTYPVMRQTIVSVTPKATIKIRR